MTEEMTKTVGANTVFGEPRKFTFKIMDAETGGKLFHEFASIISISWDTIAPVVKQFFNTGEAETETEESGIGLEEILKILPTIFDWETIKRVSADMLVGTEVALPADDGTIKPENVHTIPESGICTYAPGDPLEQYLVLFHAVCANYPKYISFLGLSLDSDQPNEAETNPEK